MEKLRVKQFDSQDEMVRWANSKDGTDCIISINFVYGKWKLFYIK